MYIYIISDVGQGVLLLLTAVKNRSESGKRAVETMVKDRSESGPSRVAEKSAKKRQRAVLSQVREQRAGVLGKARSNRAAKQSGQTEQSNSSGQKVVKLSGPRQACIAVRGVQQQSNNSKKGNNGQLMVKHGEHQRSTMAGMNIKNRCIISYIQKEQLNHFV
jgi:hypothetical protein